MFVSPETAGAFLTIDLKAIAENRRSLQARLRNTVCAAVLKANAYGLGADEIGAALYESGCSVFFTAYAFEGAALRPFVGDSDIYLLHGAWRGTEEFCLQNRLTPVLGTPEQIADWDAFAAKKGEVLTVGIHVDTGMTRFGLTARNVDDFCKNPPKHLRFKLIVSHLACADDPENAKNERQLAAFDAAAAKIEQALGYTVLKSLSATDGSRLTDTRYHKDIARPGIALYDNAVRLDARILQVAQAQAGQTVGYGAAYVVDKPRRFITLGIGYADGFSRALFQKASVAVGGFKCPVVGKVSMDLIVADATVVPESVLAKAETAEIFGDTISLKEFAVNAGTIDYEMLTNLGNRFCRFYKKG